MWNWELPEWPKFTYKKRSLHSWEREFLLNMGSLSAYLKAIDQQECKHFIVEILSLEGWESAKIEGELLNRESLQSSIKRHFGLPTTVKKESVRESQMAELLYKVYSSFEKPLTHEMLWEWHKILFKNISSIEDRGKYRTHKEPMQIVSHRWGSPRIFFEAPPSSKVRQEMERFIQWFNDTKDALILERAAMAHLYFENIHPFEDGNGRIGRLLVEKALAQGVGRPVLIAVSKILERRKKEYYAELGKCNRSLDAHEWMHFFSSVILQAQEESINMLYFLMEKAKIFAALTGQLNERQEKALLRMFAEGPEGFKGGMSAGKYITITKASRATATRDLADLVEKRVLVKTGELRHARYALNLPINR